MFHDEHTIGAIHVPYNWLYADAAERTGADPASFVTADLGKLARQSDDDSLWMLTALTPTWTSFGTSALGVTADNVIAANALVFGNAGDRGVKSAAGLMTDGVSKLLLGVAGASVGAIVLANATTGTITIQPVTGALGTVTLSAPATTGTLALVDSQTFGTYVGLPLAPTTAAAGRIGFAAAAWAASRGAIQVFDGTANTYVVAALVTDTPTNGQVPTWNTGGTITWESAGGSPGGSDTQIQFNNSGAFGGSANLVYASSVMTLTNSLAAATVGNGAVLTNATAATAGNQRYSPALVLSGNGWKTASTAGSQVSLWRIYSKPRQDVTSPASAIQFASAVNGGSDENVLLIENNSASSGHTSFTYQTNNTVGGNFGAYSMNGTTKAYAGVEGSAGGIVTGTAQFDFFIRFVDSGKKLALSFDNGGSVGASIAVDALTVTGATSTLTLGTATVVATSGALAISAVGTNKAITITSTGNGSTSFANTTEATSITAASVAFAGGVGFAKKLWLAGDANIVGNGGDLVLTTGGSTGYVVVSSANNARALQVSTTSGYTPIEFQRNRVTKGYVSTAGATDDLIVGSAIDDLMLRSTNAKKIIFSTDGGGISFEVVASSGGVKTSAPSGGTAGAWKFGIRVAAAVVLDATQYIQLDVGGTLYKVGVVV